MRFWLVLPLCSIVCLWPSYWCLFILFISIRSSVYQCILLHRPFITADLPNGDSYMGLMWVISNLEGLALHCSDLIDLQHLQNQMCALTCIQNWSQSNVIWTSIWHGLKSICIAWQILVWFGMVNHYLESWYWPNLTMIVLIKSWTILEPTFAFLLIFQGLWRLYAFW